MDVPVDKQKKLLDSMGVGTSDEDRSFKQFRGHHIIYHWWKEVIVEFGSFVVLPFFLIFCFVKYWKDDGFCKYVEAIGDFKKFFEIVPQSLKNEFDINNDFWNQNFFLSWTEIKYLLNLFFRYPVPCFILKVAIKLSYYKYVVVKYTPKAIIVHNEASYASSILTKFCVSNGIEHINVMHGEKLFFIGDGYFHFSRCYVWNEYYKNLFINMNAEESQFIIELPPSFCIDTNKYFDPNSYSDYKYYLQNFTEEQLINILKSLEFIERLGKTIKFRPHPRGHNLHILEKYVSQEKIEYPSDVSILTSISSMQCAISSYSTVQNQAFYSGKLTIFDDVTFADDYKKLKEYGYCFSNIAHNRLSTFVDDTYDNHHEVKKYN